MPLKIPDIATRITAEEAEKMKKLYPKMGNFVTTEADGIKGLFGIPAIGKAKGQGMKYFAVINNSTMCAGHVYDVMKVEVGAENRPLNIVELVYIRNLFFNGDDVVVQFIPSDVERLNNLAKASVLYRLDRRVHTQLPDDKDIGNIKLVSNKIIY